MSPKKSLLFYSPPFKDLAEEIVRLRGDEVELGVMIDKDFADGWLDGKVPHSKDLASRDVTYLLCMDNRDTAISQLSFIFHISKKARSFRVVMPYYVTGTMERSNNQDEVITAASLMRMIGAMCGAGTTRLYTYDVHALAIESFAGDNLALFFKTGLKLFFAKIKKRFADPSKLCIVFPDEGAYKRYIAMEAFIAAQEELGFSVAICDKRRVKVGEHQFWLKQGEVGGKACIIIDDLIRSGKTQLGCAKLLLDEGALSVDAFATHVSCPEKGWQRFDGSVIGTLYMTDSCPATAQAVRGNPHIEVLSLADSIANAVREGL